MKRAEIDEQELEEKKRQQERVAEHQQRAQDEESEPEDDWNQFIEKDEPVADTAGCEIATEQLKGFKMVGRPQEKWEKVGLYSPPLISSSLQFTDLDADNTPPARGRGRGRGKRQLKEDDDDVQPLGEADYQPAPKRGRVRIYRYFPILTKIGWMERRKYWEQRGNFIDHTFCFPS